MPISAKNKIYFGIVACGVAALITDRLTRSADPSASAATAISPSSLLVSASERSASERTVAAAPAPASNAAAPSVAESLRTASQKAGWDRLASAMHDNPFANDDSDNGKTASPSQSAAAFAQTHHLTAVVITGGQSHAMVDGRICKIGNCIDGYTLATISPRSALFQSASESVVLVMQGYSPLLQQHVDSR